VINRGKTLLSSHAFGLVAASGPTVHLRLIETTDLHLHLLPWDYYADRPRQGIGLAAAAGVIAAARDEVPNALLFDNGDFLQGTPLGDHLARRALPGPDGVHPAIAAMNALGYDAIALGNHEFNYGLDFLTRTLAQAGCPVLSANLALRRGSAPRADRLLVRPYALLDRWVADSTGQRHPIRIGVIGLAPPQVVDWDRHLLGDRLAARDMVEAARAWVPEMREAGADIVLALAHTGIGAARHHDGMENAAVPLARVPGIDALMTGHSHLLFPSPGFTGWAEVDPMSGTISGVPAVMGGCWGAHVGLIDLLLTRDGGTWRVLGARSEVRAVDGADGATAAGNGPERVPAADGGQHREAGQTTGPPSAEGTSGTVAESVARVLRAVGPAHRATLSEIRSPIGRTLRPLHSYFAHLGATEALAVVALAQARHVRARLADPGLAGLPLLSAVAPFKSGGLGGPLGYTDVPAGPMALRHVADLYPFPNAIAAIRVTGAEVVEWLERAAAVYNRIAPGSTETLLRNPSVAGYQFEVIPALDVLYDLSAPARYDAAGRLTDPGARRVAAVRFRGAPLDPAAEFVLCTNSYRLGGAGGFVQPEAARVVLSGTTMIRDILRDHIAGTDRPGLAPTDPPAAGRLRFVPLTGTSALFETGPGALAHLDEIARFAPEPRGTTRAGFLRLKLDLSGPS